MTITPTNNSEYDRDSFVPQGDWRQRFQSALERVTVAHLLWVTLFVLASVTRLWDLGSRALHHDESLHTYYSWVYSQGNGYEHHPMMHGPFLFHFNALSYLLFGDSDFTSRLTAAVFGIALVMLPWLLRGRSLLGPWGALAASTLILVSPSLLYYSRFIRHDIFAVVGAFLLFIALVRYLERPESRWIILAVATTGFVLTTHEITFVNLGILAIATGGLIFYRVLPVALLLIPGAGVLFLAARATLTLIGVGPAPEIPWQEPSTRQVIEYLADLVTHPTVAAAIAIGMLTLVVIAWLLERRRDPDLGWIDGTLGSPPEGSTAHRFGQALHDRRAWGIGAAIGGGIFVVLYTSLFSNLGGLGSGTLGAVGYWLGQHDVQRGEQPWFYYLVLAPQYEYLAVLGGTATTLYLLRYAWKYRGTGLEYDGRVYTLVLAAFWAITMFLTLSWAGEKMPWLVVHFVLPLTVLAGGGAGLVIEWVERESAAWRHRFRPQAVAYGLPIGGLLIVSFFLLNWASSGPWVDAGEGVQRSVRNDIPITWWIIYLPLGLALGLLILGILRHGLRRTLALSGGIVAALLILLQVSSGWSMNYRTGDVPRDMLIYVQTSPHLKGTVGDLERLSHELTGGMALDLQFTSGTQWPLNWYLRDFTGRTLVDDVPEQPDAPIIITTDNDIEEDEEQRLASYSYIEMPLRWWIPEDRSYRAFAIAPELNTEWRQNVQTEDPPPYGPADVLRSVGRSLWALHEPDQQARIFRLIVHRELTAPIGDYSMRVYIHDDYRTYVNDLRYRGGLRAPAT